MRKRYQKTPKETRDEIIVAYLTGENSVEELANYYKVNANTIRTWIKRYRHSQIVVSLQAAVFSVVNTFRKMSTKPGTLSTMSGRPSTYSVNRLSTTSGIVQKTVNQNQEKTWWRSNGQMVKW